MTDQKGEKNVLLVSVGQDRTKVSLYRDMRTSFPNLKLLALESESNKFAAELQALGIVDQVLNVDLTSRPTLLEECIDVIDKGQHKLDGILTFWDDAVGLSVRLSEHYGLPGNDVQCVDVAHDKFLCRKHLYERGFVSPMYTTFDVSGEKSLMQKTKEMNFPIILKPLYGAASIGVAKVDHRDDLQETFNIVSRVLEEELTSGGLMGLTFDGDSCQNVRTFCIEEFLDGPEYDVDVIMFQGEIVFAKAVDNLPLQPPNFCEIMELSPPRRAPHVVERIELFAADVLRSLGFQNGVFHVEIIDDVRLGPILVECNPRMGGGPMRWLHQTTYGVDLAEEAINVALGIRPKMEGFQEPGERKKCVTTNLHALKTGTLTDDGARALDFLEDNPNAITWINPALKGDFLNGWFTGYPSKAGRIMMLFSDATSEEAVEQANDALNIFNLNLAALTEPPESAVASPSSELERSLLTSFFDARHRHFEGE